MIPIDLAYYPLVFLSRIVPYAQQEGGELNLYQRISRSFREGPDAYPIYVGILVLGGSLIVFWESSNSWSTTPPARRRKRNTTASSNQSSPT